MRPLVVVITEGARSFARRKLRDARGSLEAAQALLAHTLGVASQVGDVRVCAPAGSDAVELADRLGLPWIRQGTGSLGARVGAALVSLAEDEPAYPPRPVLLLGDDCPGLTVEHLDAAVLALDQGARSVVGRAKDGGFWLLGLASFDASIGATLAAGVAWSTPQACASLESLLRVQFPGRPAILAEQADLDALEDLPSAARAAEDPALRARLAAVRPGIAEPLEEPESLPPAALFASASAFPRPPPRA